MRGSGAAEFSAALRGTCGCGIVQDFIGRRYVVGSLGAVYIVDNYFI
jgi:hypothetical protein